MANYRKIYEEHYGAIPKNWDVHHKDGNKHNNHWNNLEALSRKDHYKKHLKQGDLGAAQAIAMRMKISPSEFSKICREAALKRVADGRHNFVGDKNPMRKMVKEGTHPWLGRRSPEWCEQNRRRQIESIKKGKHNFVGDGSFQRSVSQQRIAKGTHNFLTKHTCPHCGLVGAGPQMFRWHFSNCRKK